MSNNPITDAAMAELDRQYGRAESETGTKLDLAVARNAAYLAYRAMRQRLLDAESRRAEVERLRSRGDDFRTAMVENALARDAATARAEAAEALVAGLRGALEKVNEALCGIAGLGNMAKQVAVAYTAINAAIALTPASAANRIKAEALRETATELENLRDHIQEYIGPDDARDDIRRICWNRAKDLRAEADRLTAEAEKEAANG